MNLKCERMIALMYVFKIVLLFTTPYKLSIVFAF